MIIFNTKVNDKTSKLFRGMVVNYIQTIDEDDVTSLQTINDVKAIISEAVGNVNIHAYKEEDTERNIKVTFDHTKENGYLYLYITVEDEGIGMQDVKKCMEPLYSTINNEDRAGLGFTIMETLSDDILVSSNPNSGTIVRLVKKLGRYEEE